LWLRSRQIKCGKTPVLSPEEARRVLDAIDVSTQAGYLIAR
jgi:hypothetical protein